jgi:hypothetical protein
MDRYVLLRGAAKNTRGEHERGCRDHITNFVMYISQAKLPGRVGVPNLLESPSLEFVIAMLGHINPTVNFEILI